MIKYIYEGINVSKRVDIRGKIHNNLLPLRFIKEQNTHALWKCKCLKCGKATFVTYSNIVSGNTKSCASCGKRKLSPKQDKEIAKKYTDEYYSITELSKIYKVGRNAIYKSLERTGTPTRKAGVTRHRRNKYDS